MPDAATLAQWAAASQALLFVTKSPGDTLESGKINLLDTSGGPGTFTLPDPSLTRDPVVAKRTGASDATIDVFGGGTIDGALTNVLTVDQETVTYSALDPNYRGTAGLGTPSTPLAHAPSHESGGSDEIVYFPMRAVSSTTCDASCGRPSRDLDCVLRFQAMTAPHATTMAAETLSHQTAARWPGIGLSAMMSN